jgi:hypothetical protein
VIRGPDGRATRVRYVLPRHKAANWVGPGRGRTSTRPGANGVAELSPFEFLDRLADLVPPPRKHRHRYHGVFAPNHKLRPTVTALAIGNVGNRREAAAGGHGGDGHATEGCYDATPSHKPRSHDTSRIAWAKLMARVGEEFPLECPACGGDIRLIAFITEPGVIRKILTHLGEPLEPPPVSPARGPPTDWGELMQVHDDRAIFQATDRRAARDRHQQALSGTGRKPPMPRERQTGTRSAPKQEKHHRRRMRGVLANRRRTADTPNLAAQGQSVSRKTVAEVPLAGLSLQNGRIRMFCQEHLGKKYFPEPRFDVAGGRWIGGDRPDLLRMPETSGIGYTFALKLFEALNRNGGKIPVAVMNAATGATSIHAWLSGAKTHSDPTLEAHYPRAWVLERQGMSFNQATAHVNHKVAPLANLSIRGFVWSQGENDVGGADAALYYRRALVGLIDDWRDQFRNAKADASGISEMTFLLDTEADGKGELLIDQVRFVPRSTPTLKIRP